MAAMLSWVCVCKAKLGEMREMDGVTVNTGTGSTSQSQQPEDSASSLPQQQNDTNDVNPSKF